MSTLTNQIQLLIKARRTKKLELAKYLHVGRDALNDYLTGKTQMKADQIVLIAQYYGVSVAYLFGETEEQLSAEARFKELERKVNELYQAR